MDQPSLEFCACALCSYQGKVRAAFYILLAYFCGDVLVSIWNVFSGECPRVVSSVELSCTLSCVFAYHSGKVL